MISPTGLQQSYIWFNGHMPENNINLYWNVDLLHIIMWLSGQKSTGNAMGINCIARVRSAIVWEGQTQPDPANMCKGKSITVASRHYSAALLNVKALRRMCLIEWGINNLRLSIRGTQSTLSEWNDKNHLIACWEMLTAEEVCHAASNLTTIESLKA